MPETLAQGFVYALNRYNAKSMQYGDPLLAPVYQVERHEKQYPVQSCDNREDGQFVVTFEDGSQAQWSSRHKHWHINRQTKDRKQLEDIKAWCGSDKEIVSEDVTKMSRADLITTINAMMGSFKGAILEIIELRQQRKHNQAELVKAAKMLDSQNKRLTEAWDAATELVKQVDSHKEENKELWAKNQALEKENLELVFKIAETETAQDGRILGLKKEIERLEEENERSDK